MAVAHAEQVRGLGGAVVAPVVDVVDLDAGAAAAGHLALPAVAVQHDAASAVRDHSAGPTDADRRVVADPHRLDRGVAQEQVTHRVGHADTVGEPGDRDGRVGDVDVEVDTEPLASRWPHGLARDRSAISTSASRHEASRSPAPNSASLACCSAASTVAPPTRSPTATRWKRPWSSVWNEQRSGDSRGGVRRRSRPRCRCRTDRRRPPGGAGRRWLTWPAHTPTPRSGPAPAQRQQRPGRRSAHLLRTPRSWRAARLGATRSARPRRHAPATGPSATPPTAPANGYPTPATRPPPRASADQGHEPGVGGVQHPAHLGHRRLGAPSAPCEQVYVGGVTQKRSADGVSDP